MRAASEPGGPGADIPIESSIRELGLHDHVCLIYEGEEERLRAMAAFIRFGLERDERCLYVADAGTAGAVESAMRSGGVDVDSALGRGALAIATERQTYLAAGKFDPDAMIELATGAALQAVGDRYRGLRIAGEMTWALGPDTGAERVMEYEVKVNERLPDVPALACCQYDRRRFSADVIRDVIRTHPLVVVNGRLCRNFYYVPPRELVAPDRLAREVDRLLENIHERACAEDALREKERRLARVVEGSNDAFWDLELATGRISFTQRWAEILGRDVAATETDFAAWLRMVNPDDVAAVRRSLEDHLAGRAHHAGAEFRVPHADGGWRWIVASGRIVESTRDGKPARVAGRATDVTETRILQARLERAGRLASVGTLAAGVAHEISNPLSFVASNLSFAAEQLDAAAAGGTGGEPLEEARRAIADAIDGAERVGTVVKALRRFARPGGDEQPCPVDVRAEIEAAVAIARSSVSARARLTVDLPREIPWVVAAPNEIGQVVVNLLVNAAQAVPEGRTGDVRVFARVEGPRVVVEVSDDGCGIAAEVLQHVFDPFFTTKQAETGTGLGLSICHAIVTGAGGTIDVRSEPGRGTTVRVELPAASAAAPDARAAAGPAPARAQPVDRD